MRVIKILLIIQLFCCLPIFAAQLAAKGNFTLAGKINGRAPKQIILTYTDYLGKLHEDTARINQGRFEFNGIINGPTVSRLTGDIKSRSFSDPNITTLFLEPTLMKVELTVDNFSAAIIKGSSTQNEFHKLNMAQQPGELELLAVRKTIDSLNKMIALQGNSKDLQDKVGSLESRAVVLHNLYNEIKVQFVRTHNASALTAYLLPVMISRDMVSTDSAERIFNKFPLALRNSAVGLSVESSIISKRAVDISKATVVAGNLAPTLNALDITGKPLRTEDYIGKKYVLLNFWATWCGPCHEQFPYLNELYNKYGKKGLEMISISADVNRDRLIWKKDIVKSKIGRWKNMLAVDDRIKGQGKEVADRFGITAVPTLVLIDKSGAIVYRDEGSGDKVEMKKLDDLIRSAIGL